MDALWVVLTLLVAGGVGWPVTTAVLKLARTVDEQEEKAGTAGPTTTATAPDAATGEPEPDAAVDTSESGAARPAAVPVSREGVLRGGLVIGVLERLGVAVAILANEPVAIAYVVAIKGLGRYAELKETPAAAERFIIGTLTSLLWAAAVASLAAAHLL